ncbi:MAG: hypothetical protein GDA49_05720 [Rhodospirillales bacterium]|nr:hypothetical protein [Rhodospirillales bacterium]
MTETADAQLFPEFERYVDKTGLLANAKGKLAARLPRILGQGKTRAEGLDLPPATIERQQEFLALSLPEEATREPAIRHEKEAAQRAVDAHADQMRHPENQRRFALQVLRQLDGVNTGNKNNHFFAGRFILVPDKSGLSWSWSMTPHYAMISKIPADVDYVVRAYEASERVAKKSTMPVDQFLGRLSLAWSMARHFSEDENVLITDVARLFKIAVQDDRFWKSPARRNFGDVPDAVFIINLINWRQHQKTSSGPNFELVPATLNQAHGSKSRAFFVPGNAEGTVVRPMIYIRRTSKVIGRKK